MRYLNSGPNLFPVPRLAAISLYCAPITLLEFHEPFFGLPVKKQSGKLGRRCMRAHVFTDFKTEMQGKHYLKIPKCAFKRLQITPLLVYATFRNSAHAVKILDVNCLLVPRLCIVAISFIVIVLRYSNCTLFGGYLSYLTLLVKCFVLVF
jgi:hypothetical protein